jgi:HPt (histidine-containing phosphotransfer) domain-containing protein
MTESIEISLDRKLRPLIPKFFARRADELGELKAALRAKDFTVLARIGHTLRGSASSYGFGQLAQLGGRIEEAAKSRDTAALASLAVELEGDLGRTKVRYV